LGLQESPEDRYHSRQIRDSSGEFRFDSLGAGENTNLTYRNDHPKQLAFRVDRLKSMLDQCIDALGDPRRKHHTAVVLILLYVLLWWAYAVVEKNTQGIHIDMAEQFSWSLQPAFGYPKHPPFCAWVVGVWFAVFPRANWAYYMLSVSMSGVALGFSWLISVRVVDGGQKRAVALVFLAFATTFNFIALKYNQDSMLIPTWAVASWLFLRSFERRTLLWGCAAGLGAAVTMLTKYWSFFLILGFIAGALSDPRRALYLRSPAPWASVIVGAALLAPNIVSLIDYNFEPFSYAVQAHAARTYLGSFVSIGSYFTGVLYIAGGFLALVLAAQPDVNTWRDMLWPTHGERRLMMTVTLVAWLAPVVLAIVPKTNLGPLWTMPCWSMLPAILLSAPRLTVTPRAAGAVLATAFMVPLVALLAAPAWAFMILEHGPSHMAVYDEPVAREAERLWSQVSDKPLAYVTGNESLAWACSFYCRSRPRALPNFSFHQAHWISRDDMLVKGFIAICETVDRSCIDAAYKFAGHSAALSERTIALKRRDFGTASVPQNFTFIISLPPKGRAAPTDRSS
jgi:Dolichyl-phosphate-mannose-protein mannosyltransferase